MTNVRLGEVICNKNTMRIDHEVEGAIIIGAGPSGLATALSLQQQGVPYVILERAECVAPLWKKNTYDRLRLHTPKQCCHLPFLPFPSSHPTFLTRLHFLQYLHRYSRLLLNPPLFNHTVVLTSYSTSDPLQPRWLVHTRSSIANNLDDINHSKYCNDSCVIFSCRWLVVASGENSEAFWPNDILSLGLLDRFQGRVMHSCHYKNGKCFINKKVLVIGAGNSGMEIALDLVDSGATSTTIVVRSPVHVLPRQMFGRSTFTMGMTLSKIFPVRFVDRLLIAYSHIKFGDTSKYGLRRPKIGPLELKNKMGKTPILDVGTFSKIQKGDIKVKPTIESISESRVYFVDNTVENYDAIILATGYKSTIMKWLHLDENTFFNEQGLSRPENSWKGNKGLYAVGLSGKGLLGATSDALNIARDIKGAYFSFK